MKGGHGFTGVVGSAILALLAAVGIARAQPPEAAGPAPAGPVTGAASNTVTLPEVVVTAAPVQADGSASNGYRYGSSEVGPLGRLPLKETPLSVHVTSGELIANRDVHDPVDALKTAPTVMPLMSAGGYSSMHRVLIRGFSASDQSELRDGLTDRSFTLQPVEDIDRIEVLNGASSFLYGFSSVGGTVNYVTKPPTETPLATLSMGQYNEGVRFGHVDLGGPLGSDSLGYRMNVYGEDGEGYIDDSEQTRGLLSGALRYRLLPDTHLFTAFYVQSLDMEGLKTYFDSSGIGYSVPDAFDPTRQYGQPWTRNESEKGIIDIGLDSKINEAFSVRGAFRRGDMWREYRYVSAKLLNEAGDYEETFVDSPRQDESTSAAYALVDARFETLDLEHTLTFGYTHWGFRFERGADFKAPLGPSSVNDPAAYDIPGDSGDQNTFNEQAVHNVLAGDRVQISPEWSTLVGLNYAMFRKETGQFNPWGTAYSPDDSQAELTPCLGLVYQPIEDLSFYSSYMQGLVNGGSAPSTAANAGEILDPSVSDQYEVGAKATLYRTLDVSLALFRIETINEYIDPSDNVYKQDGRQTHQGAEVEANARLLNCLTVVGGFTAMQAEIEKAASNPAAEGETPINVPETSARLHAEYDLPRALAIPGILTLTGGASYYGSRPVDLPNTHSIPDVTLLDAGVRYRPLDRLTLTLNVSNLTDEHYWQYYRVGDGLLLGDPRLYAFSARYTF